MMRKIVDYHKLSKDIFNLLTERYPDGYDDNDIITFRNTKGDVIEAVEIRTDDTVYLVKIDVKPIKAVEDFAEEEDGIKNDESADTDSLAQDNLE